MAQQQITISVSDETYETFQQFAARERRSLEEAVIAAMQLALHAESALPEDWQSALDAMAWLDTPTLQQIIERGAETEEIVLLKALSEQRQQVKTPAADEAIIRALIKQHDRAVLIRAQALALLHQRGEDVSAIVVQP